MKGRHNLCHLPFAAKESQKDGSIWLLQATSDWKSRKLQERTLQTLVGSILLWVFAKHGENFCASMYWNLCTKYLDQNFPKKCRFFFKDTLQGLTIARRYSPL